MTGMTYSSSTTNISFKNFSEEVASVDFYEASFLMLFHRNNHSRIVNMNLYIILVSKYGDVFSV